MTTSQLIPSFEERVSSGQHVRPSQYMQHIRWKPFGPLADSIYVADDPSDPSSPQKCYQTGPATFHPISASPLTEPPISSITVTQADLEDWEENWVEEHVPHADDEQAVWVDLRPGAGVGGGMRRRPVVPPALTVTSISQPFVTIHDYITAVHQWLHKIKGSILEAKGVHECQPLPANTPVHDIFNPNLTSIFLNQREQPFQTPGSGTNTGSSSSGGGAMSFFQQIAAGQTPQPMSLAGFSEEYLRGLREDSAAIQRARQAGRSGNRDGR